MSAQTLNTPVPALEHREQFDCFGSECTVIVSDGARDRDAAAAATEAKRRLRQWHHEFSRFEAGSELSALNRDPAAAVAVSPLMRRIVAAAAEAALRTGGLVDPTLGAEIEQAGYAEHFEGPGLSLERALALAPPRRSASPSPAGSWRALAVDRRSGTVSRPPGVRLDLGGIAKGVFADELGGLLSGFGEYVVDCGGDMRIGGRAAIPRVVHVASPFDAATLHSFALASGGVATSGIGRRSWIGADGAPAHHLLDPGTGRPVFSGVVQATALAPTAAEAEMLSKAAVLSGPGAADQLLRHGGAIVLDDGSYRVIEP
jgi:thiamine biosynthesis lipoprotein